MTGGQDAIMGPDFSAAIRVGEGAINDALNSPYAFGAGTIGSSAIVLGTGLLALTATTSALPLLIAAMGIAAGIAGIGAGIAELGYAATQDPVGLKKLDADLDQALKIAGGPFSLGLTAAGGLTGRESNAVIGTNAGTLTQGALGLFSAIDDYMSGRAGWKVSLEATGAILDVMAVDWSMEELQAVQQREAERLEQERARKDRENMAEAGRRPRAADADARHRSDAQRADQFHRELQRQKETEENQRKADNEGRQRAEDRRRSVERAWQKHLDEQQREREEKERKAEVAAEKAAAEAARIADEKAQEEARQSAEAADRAEQARRSAQQMTENSNRSSRSRQVFDAGPSGGANAGAGYQQSSTQGRLTLP